MPAPLLQPPRTLNPEGKPRRVGVELEFHGLDSGAAAELVRGLYGGRIEAVDAHCHRVEASRLGAFTVELDSSYAHPDKAGADKAGTDKAGTDKARTGKSGPEAGGLADRLKTGLAGIAGGVIGLWMPTEIGAPPLPHDRIAELQPLLDRLRESGAAGTRASPLYAFGMQLNVEIAAREAGYVTRHLRAYLLLSDWLRSEIRVDPTRRALPYVDPFPRRYALKVVDPDYDPGLGTLIDDYLADNPTRNRELDLLPLFADLDPERLRRHVAVDAIKVKPRPTFHYRLPNSLIDDPDWGGVAEEWNRWVRVEQLAADERLLADTARAYIGHYGDRPLSDWAERIRALLA